MDVNEKTLFLKDEVKGMYEFVNEKNDVKYILLQTKSAGLIKCNNLNLVDFKLKEKLEDGHVENKVWTYEWTNKDVNLVTDICKQSMVANMREDVKIFKIKSHEFYYGEVVVRIPKTEIEFKDGFCILKNAYDGYGENKFQYLMLKYEDIEFMYTYGYS